MSQVNLEIFAQELLEQEQVVIVFTGPIRGLLPSYMETYPRRLGDQIPVSRLYKRLVAILPKGVWRLHRVSGEIIQNRNAPMVKVREPK